MACSLCHLSYFLHCLQDVLSVQYAFDFSSIWVTIIIYTSQDCSIIDTSMYNPRILSGGDFVSLSFRRKVTEWALCMMMCCPCHGFSLSLSTSPWHFSSPAKTFLLVSLLPMCISSCHTGEIFVQLVHTVNLRFMLFDMYLMHILKPNRKEQKYLQMTHLLILLVDAMRITPRTKYRSFC